MAKYRQSLPQLDGGIFLSDGGMETSLIFQDGVDLPHFASFVLLETENGRGLLTRYYENYLAVARENGLGFVLDSATWRANADWGARLGYDSGALRRVNDASIELIAGLRAKWERQSSPVVLNGVLGPRGDGYKAGDLGALEAEAYHAPQVESFARSKADMVSAITMNTIPEALGIARAAQAAAMPCVISFTVETDGRLVGGETLRQAVETVDDETGGYPAYFMINCAHPTHFQQAVDVDEAWLRRIHGVRANASAKSHAELDDSTELDPGDPVDLGDRYLALRRALPSLRVLGGCCGTDHRHIAAICEACAPQPQNA